jgi:hypothetical protein
MKIVANIDNGAYRTLSLLVVGSVLLQTLVEKARLN